MSPGAFFVERPRFAIVISLVITLAGVVALFALPIARFPELAPPSVKVTASYPGASAEVVEQSVAAPLEQEINGAKKMIYMDSVSSNDGRLTITVTFEVGTDVDMAAVDVQNRVQRGMPKLPQEVQRQGVKVEAASPNMLVVVSLTSEGGSYDESFLNNYVTLYLKDSVGRVNGVGQVTMFGAEYGMRIWLDPERLKSLELSPEDVAAAIREQNAQIPAGRVGAPPNAAQQRFQLTVSTQGRLVKPEEFARVIIRANPDGSMVRVEDVGKVELGAEHYDLSSRLNGQPTSTFAVYQTPGANALETRAGIEQTLDDLAKAFPKGVSYQITYDATRVITASIKEVQITLFEAVALVILVVFVFLANFRATVVPGLAVPVALIGTLALMLAMGFSINVLSLFGLILAIGIVVDDAILVVETATRNMEERGQDRKEATLSAMKEVTGAVIASTLVLLAVFVPVAFMPGMAGRIYNQFALTIAVAVLISTVNALTLSPALCSLVLKAAGDEPSWVKRTFDRFFLPTRDRYVRLVESILARRKRYLLVFAGLLVALYFGFGLVPGGFIPLEDEGNFFAHVQLPDAASLNRTQAVLRKLEKIAKSEPDIADGISIAGFNLLAGMNTSNSAFCIFVLKPWDQRKNPEQHASAIVARLQAKLAQIEEASVFLFQPPAIPGLGNTQGLDFQLQDRSGGPLQVLGDLTEELRQAAMAQPSIASAVSTFRPGVPQVFLEIDREQAKTAGVAISTISDTLAGSMGSRYVNDFTLFGRTFRVMLAAQTEFSDEPEDLLRLFVTNSAGAQVPMSALARVNRVVGPESVSRFNLYRSAKITVMPAPGHSSGEAIAAMEQVAASVLPPSLGYAWSGSAVEEKKAGGAATLVLMLALFLVYLFLVAQYESFAIPLAVMLVVPLAALGAVIAQLIAGLALDVYTQVGLVLLVGLTAKTAILLVELAKQRVDEGASPTEAAIEASKMRFRAVLMTALTFLFGMVPMVVASGAGAASRLSVGSAVFGGTLLGVICTLLFAPLFFVVIQSLMRRGRHDAA